MNKQKIFIYQVLPRIFGNTNPTRLYNGDLKTNGVGKFNNFTEDVLSKINCMGFNYIWYTGVIAHATQTDYTQYGLNKDNSDIVKGIAGSPYAIKDYYDVNPDYATDVTNRMQEYEDLLKKSHDAELKVIIDFVPNHVARQYKSTRKPKGVMDLGEEDDITKGFDPQNNFYYVPGHNLDLSAVVSNPTSYIESPARVTGNNSFSNKPTKNDWYETIKLNYGIEYTEESQKKHFDPIPSTWYKMKEILSFWASKGIDGFRCDMVEMVPVEFWGWVIPQIKESYPNILFIAEIYNPNEYFNYVHNGKFDYLYDKVDLYDTLVGILKGFKPTSDITFAWQHVNRVSSHLLYFLENHDEIRLGSKFLADNPTRAIPAFQLISWMNTNPVMVYFGQELGEKGMDQEGFSGKDGRTTIFDYWSLDKMIRWNNGGKFNEELLTSNEIALRKKYIEIIKLAKTEECIAKGYFYDLMYANYNNRQFNSEKKFVFIRNYEGNFLLIVNNFSGNEVDIEIKIPHEAYVFMNIAPENIKKSINLQTSEAINKPEQDKKIKMHLKPWDSTIYKFSI